MEVNRDEAERCIDIAIAALTHNQPEKAQRFLEKAQRLFPTDKAKGKMRKQAASVGKSRSIICIIINSASQMSIALANVASLIRALVAN